MGHLSRQHSVFAIALLLTAIQIHAAHANEEETHLGELALPCEEFSPTKNVCSVGLRPCNSWASESGKPMKGVKDELIALLDRRFNTVRDGLYQDKQIVLYKATPEDRAKSGGFDLIMPSANGQTRGYFAATDLSQLNETNSFEPYDGGRACVPGVDEIRRTGRKHSYVGSPERVRTDKARGSVSCGFPGYTDRSGNNYLAAPDGVDRPGHRESLEISYRKGAWIAAMDCYLAQVKEEIRQGKFNVRSHACKAIAGDIKKLYVSAKGTGNNVMITMDDGKKTKNLCSQSAVMQAMKPVPDFCSEEETAETGTTKDKNDYRIAGCQLASMRSNIESAFLELMSCEVNARAIEARNIAFVDTGKQQRDSQFSTFYENWLVKGQVVSKYASEKGPGCEARAERFARSKAGRKCRRACAEGHGAREATRCYDENIESMWTKFLRYHFPQNGACKHTFNQRIPATESSMPWGLLLGTIAIPRIRRRRKIHVFVGPSLIIVGMAFFWAACGGKKGGGSQGVVQYPPYDSISRNNTEKEDQLRLAEAQKGAADRNRAALASAYQADRLVKGENKEVGDSLKSAAKAGSFDKKNVEFKGRGAKDGDGSDGSGTKTAGTGGGGGGANSGTGGGGGGLGGGGSGVNTEAGSLLTLHGDPGGMVEDAASAGAGQYAGGKGGSGGGGRGSKSDNPFGAGAGVDGGNSSMQFGASTSKGDVNAMGTEDPADYFSRIGVFESIFKRVSNRYQEKSRTWSTTEAAELAGSGSQKSLK